MPLEERCALIIPYFNTPEGLSQLLHDIPESLHSQCWIVDDCSHTPPTKIVGNYIRHSTHLGYGGAQKTGYRAALSSNAEICIMLHGDNQYKFAPCWEARKLPGAIKLGSRLRNEHTGSMPSWRRLSNNALTTAANLLFGTAHTDLHTGARLFTRPFLEEAPFESFENGFIFDQQILAYALAHSYTITEFDVPVDYGPQASSIPPGAAMIYGIRCLETLARARVFNGARSRRQGASHFSST